MWFICEVCFKIPISCWLPRWYIYLPLLSPIYIEVKCPYSVRDSDIFAKDVHKKVDFLELVEG
jgi:hypothetical protein